MTHLRALHLWGAAIGVALATSTAAYAADLPSRRLPPIPPPLPVPVFSWTGFYVGVSAGADILSNSWRTTSLATGFATDGVSENANFDETRARVGGYVGYNYQIDKVVLGLEGDAAYDFGSRKTVVGLPGTLGFVAAPNADRTSAKSEYDASIRGRVGFTLTPSVLAYATGGVAFRDASYSVSCPGGAGAGNSWCATNEFGQNNTTRVGYTVGGGIEGAITNNLIARAEYRYSDFGSKTISFFGTPANADFVAARTRLTASTVTVGLAYKFGFDAPAPVVARY